MSDRISNWLAADPRAALAAASDAAEELMPGHLGVCVSAVMFDHGLDSDPDPNIHELAYALLALQDPSSNGYTCEHCGMRQETVDAHKGGFGQGGSQHAK